MSQSFFLRLSHDLKQPIERMAREQDRSMSNLVTRILRAAVAEDAIKRGQQPSQDRGTDYYSKLQTK
jgi:predicted transcriptional regulator